MKPRLFIVSMAGLLWAATFPCTARELSAGDPARMALVDVARNTPVDGLPVNSGITLSRAWVNGGHGKVCAVARRADGELLMVEGALQIKRVELRKRGATWDVERAERLVMRPDMSIDAACQQRAPDTAVADAIKGLRDNPPAAGLPHATPRAPAACAEAAPPAAPAPTAAAPGVVAVAGRSLLHTTPDPACRMGKHIVKGDKVMILTQKPGWAQVRYTHPVTQVVTVGWLPSERIKPRTPDIPG
ncbi:MAG: hypothetical protein ACM3VZ_09770 [Acidobacteriota bacterium]